MPFIPHAYFGESSAKKTLVRSGTAQITTQFIFNDSLFPYAVHHIIQIKLAGSKFDCFLICFECLSVLMFGASISCCLICFECLSVSLCGASYQTV